MKQTIGDSVWRIGRGGGCIEEAREPVGPARGYGGFGEGKRYRIQHNVWDTVWRLGRPWGSIEDSWDPVGPPRRPGGLLAKFFTLCYAPFLRSLLITCVVPRIYGVSSLSCLSP